MNFKRDKKELIVFDRKHCKSLLDNNKVIEAQNYLKYFFFSYENKIFFFNGYEFILYTKEEAIKLIPDDFKLSVMVPNDATKKYERDEVSLKTFLKSTEFMNLDYKPSIDFTNEALIISKNRRIRGFDFTENYLNMAKPYNFDVILGKPIKPTKEIKENLNLIYEHIKAVLCSGDESAYEYLLNFIACSFNGRKIRKAILLQSKERTGKGIIINDLLKAILGDRMHKTNSIESIMRYTKPFEGCVLLNFDELPHSDNYKGLQDNLKALITEPEFTCRDMYSSGYQQKNTFNILITTNNDAVALTQNNNSRYVCLDINESKIGDTAYFTKLSKAIKHPYVLEQFYNEMKIRFDGLNQWNEDEMPFTETRKLKIIEALPPFYKYLKEQFILTNTDLNQRTDQFLEEYKLISKDRSSSQKIGKMLTELGIKPHKNSKNNGYNYIMTSKELYDIFKSRNWIDETIDLINDIHTKPKPNVINEKCDFVDLDYVPTPQTETAKKEVNQIEDETKYNLGSLTLGNKSNVDKIKYKAESEEFKEDIKLLSQELDEFF